MKKIKSYLKDNKQKIIVIGVLLLVFFGWSYYSHIKKWQNSNKIQTTNNLTTSNNKQIKNNVSKTKSNAFINIIQWFNTQFETKLPLYLKSKSTDWNIVKEYFSCLSYDKITNEQLNSIPWLKKYITSNVETKNLLKKQYEKYCNNLLYTKYPVIFVYNKVIIWSQDVLPWSLLKSLEKYMLTNKQQNNYIVLKQFFDYKKLWLIWIIKWKTVWFNSYKIILKSLKWKKLDKQTQQNILDFNKIIKIYLK